MTSKIMNVGSGNVLKEGNPFSGNTSEQVVTTRSMAEPNEAVLALFACKKSEDNGRPVVERLIQWKKLLGRRILSCSRTLSSSLRVMELQQLLKNNLLFLSLEDKTRFKGGWY